MHDVNRVVIYISNKYSMQRDPLNFEWDKLIVTLEIHFPDILEELLNCHHQRYGLVHNQGQSISAKSNKLNINFRCGVTEGKHKEHPFPDFQNWKPEAKLNIMAVFATEHQKYHTTVITMAKLQTPLSSKDTSHASSVKTNKWTM